MFQRPNLDLHPLPRRVLCPPPLHTLASPRLCQHRALPYRTVAVSFCLLLYRLLCFDHEAQTE